MSLFVKGIFLEQKKEPMLSRSILTPKMEEEYFEYDYIDIPLDDLTGDQIIKIAEMAEIIDESDGKPLFEKLKKAGETSHFIIDAVDDEPYISSQMCVALHEHQELAVGIELCERVLDPDKTYVAMYRHIFDANFGMPSKIGPYKVRKMGGLYPAENRVHRHIPKGKNYVVIGACALVHIARAAVESRKMTTCFVTVAGTAVKNPRNIELPIGTSAQKAIELCGLTEEPEVIVMGGAMTGRAIFEPENEVVTPTTKGIIALTKSYATYSYNCIGCGRCDHACPKALSVSTIRRLADAGKLSELPEYDIDMCIGCGACSYVCPSRIEVSATVLKAKKQLELLKKEGV